ncbi:MAG: hypothetical protein ACFFBP_17895 [Promethearchaeota archaeon]
MDKDIKKTVILDPEKENPFTPKKTINCRACKKPISKQELNDAIRVNAGMSVDDAFFPEKRTYYYHKNCYKETE